MLHFRPHTIDQQIYHAIYHADEYDLPETFATDDIVVDVGAHVGYFACRVLEKGAGKVISVEAERENYELACRHLKTYTALGKAEVLYAAVWRSDENDDVLYHSGYTHFPNYPFLNSGGGDVLWGKTGAPLPKLPLDELLLRMTDQGRKKIRLLKLDCEGSEWPILLTARYLHLVEEICGEYHEIGGAYDDLSMPFTDLGYERYTEGLLGQVLQARGFSVDMRRHIHPMSGKPERLGLFFAKQHE